MSLRSNSNVIFVCASCIQPSASAVESSTGLNLIGGTWNISSAYEAFTATIRLESEQPETLVVDIPSDVPTPMSLRQLCEAIQQRFTGSLKLELWHSYINYDDCSEMIETLASSRWGSLFLNWFKKSLHITEPEKLSVFIFFKLNKHYTFFYTF